MSRELQLLRCRMNDGATIRYIPSIHPSIAPSGLMTHLRRAHPDLWRIARLVYRMDEHNRRVERVNSHADAQRYFAAQRAISGPQNESNLK